MLQYNALDELHSSDRTMSPEQETCLYPDWYKSDYQSPPQKDSDRLAKLKIEALLSPTIPSQALWYGSANSTEPRGTKRKRDENDSCPLLEMPTEILLIIASHLGSTSALKFSQCSQRLFDLRQAYFDTPIRRQVWSSSRNVLRHQIEFQMSHNYLSRGEWQRLYDVSHDTTRSPVINIVHLRGIFDRRISELDTRLARSISNSVKHQGLLTFPVLTIHDMVAVQEIQVALDRGFEPCSSCQSPRMDMLISRVKEADRLRKRNLSYSSRASGWRRMGAAVLGVAEFYGFEMEFLSQVEDCVSVPP